ncbi:MAG: hypothetical protein ACRYG5_09265 [Janthinobacterium lividum]
MRKFVEEWAPDLAGLIHIAMPHLRYVAVKDIDNVPGMLLTAARVDGRARFAYPLNAFLYWPLSAIDEFFDDPLSHYVSFNGNLDTFFVEWQTQGIDVEGGSQREARTMKLCLPSFGVVPEAD